MIATRTLTIVIHEPAAILTDSLPAGRPGVAYSFTLQALGQPPFTWSAQGLPPGLSISPQGVISGTPAAAGSYTVVFSVQDSGPV
jgi:hypothetical protein